MFCKRCKVPGFNGTFCPTCGDKLIDSQVDCPFCRAKTPIWGKFCSQCGRPIHEHINAVIEGGKGGD